MRNFVLSPPTILLLPATLAFIIAGSACQNAVNTNETANTNMANVNATPVAAPGSSPAPGASIEAREPDKYQAKLTIKAQTTGSGQNVAIPSLTSDVARDGDSRRLSLVLPGGEEVVYLDRTDKRYVILPKRKQYAELTPQSTGFEVPRFMTPGQVIEQLKSVQGYERVGEETYNGRAAIKYRYAGAANTGTQAGEVKTEAFVYVDKETGLPLHSDIVSQSEKGEVKGISGIKFTTELTDINTNIADSMFEVPQGYQKVSDQQVRQYVDTATRAVIAIVGQVLQSTSAASNNANSNTGAATAASPTPSPVK